MRHTIVAAAVALALAACVDGGPLLQNRAPTGPVSAYIPCQSESIFTTQVPTEQGYAYPGWQVGTQFTAEDSLLITKFRFYKATGETGPHTAKLYTVGGTLVASAGFGGETASGWQSTTLVSPVLIPPGEYVVTVNTNTYQAKSGGYFAFNGSIQRTSLKATGGRYGQPINSYPVNGSSSAFFVDVTICPRL